MDRVWLFWSVELKEFFLIVLGAIILSVVETAPVPLHYFFIFVLFVNSFWFVVEFPTNARGFYFLGMFYGFILSAQIIYAVFQNLGVSNAKLIEEASMLDVMPSVILIVTALFLLIFYFYWFRGISYGVNRFGPIILLYNSSAGSLLIYGLFFDFDLQYFESIPIFPDVYYHVLFGCLSIMGVGVFLHSAFGFGGAASAKH